VLLLGLSLLGLGCANGPVLPTSDEVELFPRPFQIIAHRGASGTAPENTLPSFRRARELGAVEVELDVQLTRDDQVILFHDATLDRKTGMTGRVRDHSLAELVKVDIGTWFDATHPDVAQHFSGTLLDPLASLFEQMGRELFYHVELKDEEPDLPLRTLEVIDRFELRDRVLLTSFHFAQLERARQLAPELPTCLLIDRESRREGSVDDWIDKAVAAGFSEVGVAARELTREQVLNARRQGLLIRAWSIKSLEDMDHAIAVGSNGMTIDWPEKLIRRLLEHTGSASGSAAF
jgi:glycerophosphoryl diester phosphodiesterase